MKWLQAARPASQVIIAFPLLCGAALTDQVQMVPAFTTLVFGVFLQLFIVFANDIADEAGDRLNHHANMFSGGSRVLVTGQLQRIDLIRAAWSAACCAAVVGSWLAWSVGSGWILVLALSGCGLLLAYSFGHRPLSYRGGGEWLQMLGLGLVLPLIGFLAQGASWRQFPATSFAFLLPVNLAWAIASGLPDEVADRQVEKRTWAVRWGPAPASDACALLVWFAAGVLGGLKPELLAWLVAPGMLALGVVLLRRSKPGSRFRLIQVGLVLTAWLWLMVLFCVANL